MNECEEWRDIKGFEGLYQVSNIGNVKSLSRTIYYKDGRVRHNGEKLFQLTYKDGYTEVRLHKDHDRKGRLYKVHVLVAEAFIPNPENKPYIDHINTVRDDNRVENLHWVTHKENMNNLISREKTRESSRRRFQRPGEREKISIAKRRYFSNPENRNKFLEMMRNPEVRAKAWENNPRKRKVLHYNSTGEFIGEYISASDASKKTGINQNSISNYCLGKTMPRDKSLWFYLNDFTQKSIVERILKISSTYSRGAVALYNKEGEYICSYSSTRKASEATGISETAICNAIKGRTKTSGGYIWKRIA